MAKGNFAQKKEQKKPKKKAFGKGNGKITTKRAMYDNQLIGTSNNGLNSGY